MSTVRAPLTSEELQAKSQDTMFLIVELADAIRRGVVYYRLNGSPLDSLNDVIDALVEDGEVIFEDDSADGPIRH
ncbi:MAG: hypothetical protein ACE5E4_03160 [Candidatus Binatia bacterium]